MHIKRTVLAVVLTFPIFLAGCAVDHIAPFKDTNEAVLSENWTQGEGKVEAATRRVSPEVWWSQWDNPALTALIEKTLANNTDILVAQANLRSAQASLFRATSSLFPTADIGANASRNYRNHDWTESYSGNASTGWSFSFGGRDVYSRAAASASEEAQALLLVDTKNAMTAATAKAYVTLRLAQEKLAISEKNLATLQEARDIANWRYQAGLVEATDAEQANASYESACAQIQSLKHSVFTSQTALATLTVLPLSEIQQIANGAIPTPPTDIAVAMPADLLSLRADVQAAKAQVIAALYNVRVARSEFLPSLSLSGSIGTAAATVGALGASGTGIGALIGALSMPILNWGDAIAATQTQKAALDKAQANYTSTLIDALEETENTLSKIRTTKARTEALSRAQDSSHLAAQLALHQYASGLADYQTVLTTQRAWLNAQEAVASNQADWAQAHIELYQTLGGGWQPQSEAKE